MYDAALFTSERNVLRKHKKITLCKNETNKTAALHISMSKK